jgi:hypothetical protein
MSDPEFQRPASSNQLYTFCEERNVKLIKLEKYNHNRTKINPVPFDDKIITINRYMICTFICSDCKKEVTLTACVLIDNHKNSDEILCTGCSHSNKITTKTIEDFINEAKDNGYTYIDDINKKYKKNQKYKVRCKDGHEVLKTMPHLKHGCLSCCNKSMIKPEDQVVADVERNSIYKVIRIIFYNNKIDSKILVQCLKCNEECENSADNLYSNSSGCSICYRISRCHDLEERRNIFKENGCILISESYKNSNDIQEFVCKCEKFHYKTLKNFINYPRCDDCSSKMRENTCIKELGVKNVGQLQTSKDKAKVTNLEKTGYEFASQSPEFKEKAVATNKSNNNGVHNLTNPEVREKARLAIFTKTGTFTTLHTPEFYEKMIKKYNCKHSMQNAEIFENSRRYQKYNYTFKNKITVQVQGYEMFALRDLEELFPCENIFVGSSNMPVIKYLDDQNKEHIYHPDIFVNSPELFIEVKSPYTFLKDFDVNIKKWTAASKIHPIRIVVYSQKGHLLENIEFTENDNIAEYYCEKNNIALKINMFSNCGFEVLTPIEKINYLCTPITIRCDQGHEMLCDLKKDAPVCLICDCTKKMKLVFESYKLEILGECSDTDRNIDRECKCNICGAIQKIKFNNLRCKEAGTAGCKSCGDNNSTPVARVRMNLNQVNNLLDNYGFNPIKEGIYKSQKDAMKLSCKKCDKQIIFTINKIIARKTILGCGCSKR